MANQSIIILNLNDLYGLQSGESSLAQLLSILNGKSGFLFVTTGGQGKFIPLNQLHLLPKNCVPSYVVLLMRGRPNPFPGLQLINGLFQNGNQGNLGFQIPNLVNFASLPVYVVQGYYPIWSILMNLGIYQPDNGNYLPHPDPTPYPGLISPTPYPGISIGKYVPPAPTPRPIPRPTNPPVFVPQQPNIDWTGLLTIPNENNDKIFPNKDSHDVFDSELITLLLHVLNEKPGSETEHIITQEKSNPAKLLRIFIELLCQKNGNQQVLIGNKNENNPMQLLQILIKLLRQKNSSTTVIKHNNDHSEERLIQLLMKLIRQKNESQVVISQGNNNNQAKLTQLLIQLLGNRDQFNNVLISSQNNGQSQVLQNLIELLVSSNQEASHILISGNNDANSAQRLYNILLQIISSIPGSSNFGNTIYLNGGSGNSGISSESLMQLVQILLRQKQSYPTIFKNQDTSFQSFLGGGSNNFGSNSKILTMLLGSGGGSTNKSALWSYLLGNFGCMNNNGLTVLCAK
ncbi:hypothetical protein O3G_MSEX010943 [Manduca sexta]|uniref:Uncharacterized protein n=1 Tax=Manduca sexta TaxID=7130 RepID=A0A921ZID9_MANSE|nr:hypothetical protein O3G_MSEX010943 [Manduca sexta]